jgi:hypothetical protein
MTLIFRARPEPTCCYVVRVQHKIVHGGIAEDLVRARVQCQEKWPQGEVVQVGVAMTRHDAENWARKNGYLRQGSDPASAET